MQYRKFWEGMPMRIYVAGDGAREAYLRQIMQAAGHTPVGRGPAELAVLELPRSHLPEAGLDIACGRFVCGLTEPVFDALAAERKWEIFRPLRDEEYTLENARLSAEGAVSAAMRRMPFALSDSTCLVIGYGRIGRALTGMLRGLGARVIVAARRAESRLEAGEGSVPLEGLAQALPKADVIFNTVPALVLPRERLALARPDALLLELASAPYGFDLLLARKLGLRAELESGIPGRYCPRTAAKILWRYIEREVLRK